MALAVLTPSRALAEDVAVEVPADPLQLSKKQQYLNAKQDATVLAPALKSRWHKALDRRIGKRAGSVVNIYNSWTHETLAFAAKDVSTPDSSIADPFLRCHFTNEPTQMDPRLLPVLLKAASKFRVKRVIVVSGFRDPKYNLTLRKKGRQVARTSQHTLGHAVDFRLPGVNIQKLHAWARTLRLGGVGFYKHSRFIHVDVGPVRYWTGR